MNKVICYVCGTAYPENADQCPICGYVQTAEQAAAAISGEDNYTYVKGGRFSKSNVKKRNQVKTPVKPVPTAKNTDSGTGKKSNMGLTIVIILLMLAIIAVAGYIALRFFIPNDFIYEGLGNTNPPAVSQDEEEMTQDPVTEPSEPETISKECTSITLNLATIDLEGIGASHQIQITLEPADTPDTVSYSSSDVTVATVSDDGTITTVGEGTSVITVTCGSASAECTVNCTVVEILELNRKEITFNEEGQSWLIYDGTIPVEEIVWTSDDNNIATIEAGKVVAVGDGDTTVYGIYKDQTVECQIHCKFDEETDEPGGNVSEAVGDPNKTYKLYNPYGYAEDVTINPGEEFTLKLVDENLDDAEGVVWTVENENVCVFDNNTVEGMNPGMTKITATCAGKTYTCIVRVI